MPKIQFKNTIRIIRLFMFFLTHKDQNKACKKNLNDNQMC